MKHPNSWKELWELQESSGAPPSNPNKARCSSLPYKKYCTIMEQGPAGDPATRGRALHYCIEHRWYPFDIPTPEEEEIKIALHALESLEADGWRVFAEEKYLENERLTGNLDIVLERGCAVAYIDFKFGMKEVRPDSPQLIGGTELLMDTYGDKWTEYWTGVIQPFHLKHNMNINMKIWSEDEVKEMVSGYVTEKNNMHDACGYCITWVDGRCPAFKSALEFIQEQK